MDFKFLFNRITNIILNPAKAWDASIGIGKMINAPEHKKNPLLIATIATFISLFVIADWLLTRVIDKLYFIFFN